MTKTRAMTKHRGLPRWHSKMDWRTTFCGKDINNRRCSCGIPWLESSFEHDAESMKTTLQWETEHKRWGRKQKHRGEDGIRNPYQSFATACGKMPVDMLHNVPLGIWKYLLGRMIDEVTSLLVKAHTKRLYPLYPALPPDCVAIASQCEAEPEAEEEEGTAQLRRE
jgi:hypothetical protein